MATEQLSVADCIHSLMATQLKLQIGCKNSVFAAEMGNMPIKYVSKTRSDAIRICILHLRHCEHDIVANDLEVLAFKINQKE